MNIDPEFEDQLHLSGLVLNESVPEPDEADVFSSNVFGLVISKEVDNDVSLGREPYVILESQLDNALTLLNSMNKTGGMCQRYAEEAMSLFPEFGGVPLTHYSTLPTKTRYSVSLEELNGGMIALITAAVAAAIALIYKIYKWIVGDKSKDDKKPVTEQEIEEKGKETIKAIENVKDNLEENKETITHMEKMMAMMNIRIKDANDKEYLCTSFQMFIDRNLTEMERYEHMKKFLELKDPFFRDIIQDGPYSKAIVEVQKATHALIGVMGARIQLFQKAVDINIADFTPGSDAIVNSILEKLSVKSSFRIFGKDLDFKEIGRAIQEKEAEMLKNESSQKIKFDLLMTRIYERYNGAEYSKMIQFVQQTARSLSKYRDILEKLEKKVGNFTTDSMPGKPSEHVGQTIRKMMREVTDDVSGIGHIILNLTRYIEKVTDIFKLCIDIGYEVILKLTNAMKMANVKIPSEWEKAADDIRKIRREISLGADIGFFKAQVP